MSPRSFQIAGIVNLTSDSFSDGGQFLDSHSAIQHAQKLMTDSADIIDLGAESSNPHGARVDTQTEIDRLLPVIDFLKTHNIMLSVDTYKSQVVKAVVPRGVKMVNDITALSDKEVAPFLAEQSQVKLVMMFARNTNPRAEIKHWPYEKLLDDMKNFFSAKIKFALDAGMKREQLVLDPGMGFFLGMTPEPSLWVLKNLAALKREFDLPLYVCTSRKSFIGALTAREIKDRQFGTVASELYAILHGAHYIRTHNVAALADAWRVWSSIANITV